MPEKMHKAMKAIYAAHPKAIGLLQQAVECPDYDAQSGLLAFRPSNSWPNCFRSCRNCGE